MLDLHSEDRCCGARLSRALFRGALANTGSWTCPRCGVEWRAEVRNDGAVRFWSPYCPIEVW